MKSKQREEKRHQLPTKNTKKQDNYAIEDANTSIQEQKNNNNPTTLPTNRKSDAQQHSTNTKHKK